MRFVFKGLNNARQTERKKVQPGWKLKVDTLNIFFTPQVAVIREVCFSKPKFISIFLLHFGENSPSMSLTVHFLFSLSSSPQWAKTSNYVKIATLNTTLFSRSQLNLHIFLIYLLAN